MVEEVIHNVTDRISGEIGAWNALRVDMMMLNPDDVGRRIIYKPDHGQPEVGLLSSWRGDILFIRFTRGDTAAGCKAIQCYHAVSPWRG